MAVPPWEMFKKSAAPVAEAGPWDAFKTPAPAVELQPEAEPPPVVEAPTAVAKAPWEEFPATSPEVSANRTQDKLARLQGLLETTKIAPTSGDPLEADAEESFKNSIQSEITTLQSRQDLGVENASILDKIKSAGVAFAARGAEALASPLVAMGKSSFLNESEFRDYVNQTPDEQRGHALSRSLNFLAKLGYYAGASTEGAPALTAWAETDPEILEKLGTGAGAEVNDAITRLNSLEKDNYVPGFWTQELPGAVGTTGAFAAAATVTGVLSGGTIPAWATVAFLGSSLGAEQAIDDAVAHGATLRQAQIGAGVGALLGTTEAIPVTHLLDRLDNASGGVLSRRLNKVFTQKLVGATLTEGVKQAFEEGLQEMGQQLGTDAYAMYSYDPDRDITANMMKAGEAAGGSGFILGAVATALGVPLRARQQENLRRDRLAKEVERVTGEPLDPSMEKAIKRNAPFTPLTKAYRDFMAEAAGTLEQIENLTKLAKENQLLSTGELVDTLNEKLRSGDVPAVIGVNLNIGMITEPDMTVTLDKDEVNTNIEKDLTTGGTKIQELDPHRWTFDPSDNDELWSYHGDEDNVLGGVTFNGETFEASIIGPDEQIHSIGTFDDEHDARRAVEQGLGVAKFRTILTAADAIQKQPIVIAGFDHFAKRLESLRTQLADFKEYFKDTITDPKVTAVIADREREIGDYQLKAAAEASVARQAKDLLAGLRAKYLDENTKIVVVSGANTEALGGLYHSKDGRILRISLNLPELFSDKRKGDSYSPIAHAKEILLHEFGHGLVAQRVLDMQARIFATIYDTDTLKARMGNAKEARIGNDTEAGYWKRVLDLKNTSAVLGKTPATQKDFVLYRGLMQEYVTWAARAMNNPFLQRFLEISPPTHIQQAESAYGPNVLPHNTSYWYSFDEFMAENFSRVATQHPYVSDTVKGFFLEHRKVLEDMYAPYADQSSLPIFEKWVKSMSLEGKLDEEIKKLAASPDRTWYDFARHPALVKELGLDASAFTFNENLDSYQKWYDYGLNILQLARLNEHIEPLQRYIRLAKVFNQKIGSFRLQGHETMQAWRGLGSEEATELGKALFEETLGGKPLTLEDFKARNLSEDSFKVYQRIKGDFDTVLTRMEQVLQGEVRQSFFNDSVTMELELKKVQTEMNQLRSKPFFPLMRFGPYTVQVRATENFDGYKTGELVDFQTFEKKGDRKSSLRAITHEWSGKPVTIGTGYLTDSQMAVQGMSGPLLRSLQRKLSETGAMTPEMKVALDELLKDALPIESFRRHFTRRKKVKGFSQDAMRSYAAYMVQAATHLARIEMQSDLNGAVNDLGKDSREITRGGGTGTKRGQIAQMTSDHLNYMMNPSNDWPMLRSVGFIWFMGFNLKSAVVNATQLFVATHPYLAARFGDVDALAAMHKAMAIGTKYWAGKDVGPEIKQLLAKGKADGILDESFATELAVARNARSTASMIPVAPAARTWAKFSEIASWPFHTVEKMNRNLTAIAAFHLYRSRDVPVAQAIELSLEAVRNTQFEYARWARPKAMRGKIGSNLLLFKNYTQNQLFLALGKDPAAARVLFSTLILAGLTGMPLAEDMLDLFDVVATQLKRLFHWKNPKVESRLAIREMLQDMQVNPDLAMYGLAGNSMGLPYIADMAGFPFPELDLQGSLSQGNVIPGTSALKRLQEGDPNRAMLDFIGELGGAEAGYLDQLLKRLRKTTLTPGASGKPLSLHFSVGSPGRADTLPEAELTAGGQPVAEFDPTDAQNQMEVAAQAFGFTPSSVSRGWEARVAEIEVGTYYAAWRTGAMRNFNYNTLTHDADGKAAAMQGIKDFNDEVPYPEMRISAKVLQQSLEEFARQRALAGKSVPPKKSEVRLSRDIQELYKEIP